MVKDDYMELVIFNPVHGLQQLVYLSILCH